MPKIVFEGGPPVSDQDIQLNILHARMLGLPTVKKCAAHERHLAIVGGGPSIKDHIEEIRAFQGDIWAINGAFGYLADRGIDATFISVDPHEIVTMWVKGVKKALLCMRMDPKVFEALKDAEVTLFELVQDKSEGVHCCSSTASLGFDLATDLGYRTVVWYGCEGSYPGDLNGNNGDDHTHAYPEPSEKRDERMVVLCGGVEYLTAPDFYVQSGELAEIIKKFPRHFSERSGGLLRALIENDDHDVTKVSRSLMAALRPVPKPANEPLEEAA